MDQSALEPLEQLMLRSWPPSKWQHEHVLVAVSGGPDSVALLRGLLAIRHTGRGRIFAAHFDHGSRGSASDADRDWVKTLARQLDVPLVTGCGDVDTLAREQGDGWEAAARHARYNFLCQTAADIGARYLVTGHTADDQVETILFRILRGTGITGLRGIPPARPLSPTTTLVRPLLQLWRHDVVAYLSSIGQDYRIDNTNTDCRFTRNQIRHLVLPMLRERFGDAVDEAIVRLGEQAVETRELIGALVAPLAQRWVERAGSRDEMGSATTELTISTRELATHSPHLVREVCRYAWQSAGWPAQDMSREKWEALAELVNGRQGAAALTLPGNVAARRIADQVVLTRTKPRS